MIYFNGNIYFSSVINSGTTTVEFSTNEIYLPDITYLAPENIYGVLVIDNDTGRISVMKGATGTFQYGLSSWWVFNNGILTSSY